MLPCFLARKMMPTIASLVGLSGLCLGALSPVVQAMPPQMTQTVRPTPKLAAANAEASDVLLAVAIETKVSNLTLATSTPGQVVDDQGRVLQSLSGSQPLTVQASDRGMSVSGGSTSLFPNSVWIGASQGGYVWVGSRWYRGRVRIIQQGNGLLAINHVHLEEYLSSVVGSEMPASWPLEALKAQAVAARSYALVHYLRPASDFFHLGNTERWQVYKGLNSESPRTWEAVRQTSGQVLSHQGGVVESLYASTYEIVNDVHGGRGMSQYGARDLATKGYTYLHILGNYYPGVSLAQIRLKVQ